MRRDLQLTLAVVALLALQTVNGQQALSLGSAFPGDDGGDAASATPSPPAASTSPTTSPSPAAASSPVAAGSPPASAPTPAPAPGPAAGAPVKAPTPAPAKAPATAPAPGPGGALAGTPAPAGAAIATGGADIRGAPAPGPTVAPQINIAYIQQANNARMTPSPTDPNSGVLSMNGAIDTTLYDQDTPLRKLGKTSSQNFLNAATPAAGAAAPATPNQWFAPAPQAILLGFNTTNNVYILMTLSAPVYNYTIATVNFNYLLQSPTETATANATNSWLVNLFVSNPESITGALPMTNITKEATLFTPSLLTSIPCQATPTVPKGSCSIINTPGSVCAGAGQHGAWVNGTFCA